MPESKSPAYLNPDLPLAERVQDLIARLTLAEKVAMMNHPARGVPRMNIPAYNFWSEALHGVARNGRATVFPEPIGMAATWDPGLIHRIGSAIGDEARAKYHETLRRKGYTDLYQGLTFWSPNVNLFRDPRWGRGQETWGEDPYLTGELGAAFVRGLQGDDPRYLKAAACAKHYAVHSGPEKLRHTFNAEVSRQDLYATYLPAFKKLVTEAGVEAVMGAYNRTLGEPCNASQLLLVDILRGEWGFKGHVVSDCGALSDIHKTHHVTADEAESAALALKAGCDIGCDCVYDAIPEAIARGLTIEADLDRALSRTLSTRFKLGMFDPQDRVPYSTTPMSVVDCPEHRSLAYRSAVESVVLLKNKGGILPLSQDTRSILLVGPGVTSIEALLGNYYGINTHLTTILEGIAGSLPEGVRLEYRPGTQLVQPNLNGHDWSVYEAGNVEVTIACMGLTSMLEGEEGDALLSPENGDRTDIGLPAVQVEYLKRLSAQGARIILVLTGGSPIALGEIEKMVEAIVFVWYPGQEGGQAVADVLFGQQTPSGKLPMTFPKSNTDLPPFEDYSMAGRTYRYSQVEPLYPFGFGLSYTSFAYSGLALEQSIIHAGDSLSFRLEVSNQGARPAEEVVQVYLTDLETSCPAPLHSLVTFRRIQLQAGETTALSFTLTPEMMGLVGLDGRTRLEPGAFKLEVGGCSPGARGLALGAPLPVVAVFSIGE
jgi:beta-glucosidase